MRFYPNAVNQFLDDPANGLNTEQTRKGYRSTLRSFALTYPDKANVEDFTEEDLVAYCARPELAPASKAGYRTRLTGFFSWAHWRGLIPVDPSVNLKRVVGGSYSKPVRQNLWLNTAEVERVLTQIDTGDISGKRDMIIARLGFTCGLRRTEISQLRWEGIDLDRQLISLRGKGGKRASLYITDGTLPWLEKWRVEASAGLGHEPVTEPVVPAFKPFSDFSTGWYKEVIWDRPLSPEMVAKRVKAIATELGIPFRPHDMRRSYANMLEEQGYGIEEISQALRHSNIGVTQRYLERRQDAGYQAVKKGGFNV